MSKKYLMFSLDDERAKDLADVMSNKTSKKIVDYLSENDASVSDIANDLDMPLNTVDYNVKKLLKAGLIEKKKKFFWSVKGKKIPVYTVSNKHIVISPNKNKLRGFIPVLLITGLVGFIIRFLTLNSFSSENVEDGAVFLASKTGNLAGEAGILAERAVDVSSGGFLFYVSSLNGWMWFLIGAWFAVLVFYIYSLIKKN